MSVLFVFEWIASIKKVRHFSLNLILAPVSFFCLERCQCACTNAMFFAPSNPPMSVQTSRGCTVFQCLFFRVRDKVKLLERSKCTACHVMRNNQSQLADIFPFLCRYQSTINMEKLIVLVPRVLRSVPPIIF